MASKIKSFYVYSTKTGQLEGYVNPEWKVDKGVKKVYIPTTKALLSVSPKAGKVTEDTKRHEMYVWFDVIDRIKAQKAFANYILDHIGQEIRTCAAFAARVKKERAQFVATNKQ